MTRRVLLPLPCSVADHLALAERQLGPDAVPAAAWQRLGAIVDPLPVLAEDAGLELRLAGDSRVDFALCLTPAGRARRALARAIARSERAMRSSAWRRVHAFVTAWGDAGSPLHETVHAIWLEFDADGTGPPDPFVIFSVSEERLYQEGRVRAEALRRAVEFGIRSLSGAPGPRLGAALLRCLDRLPRYAQLRHVALRPTPDGDVVRLVARMPWRRAPEVIAGLGAAPAGLPEMLERLCSKTLVQGFNLDVTCDGLSPRVGMEFVHAGAPARTPRWTRLFDALEALGACSAERRRAIEDWGGEVVGPRLGPGLLVVRRDLLVKAVYEPDAPLRAKAYLAFAPRLLPLAAERATA